MRKLPKMYIVATLIVLGLTLVGTVWARTVQGPIADLRVFGSGGRLEQSNTTVGYSLGQPVVGRDSQGNTDLCAGFWCGVNTVRAPESSPPMDAQIYIPLVLKP